MGRIVALVTVFDVTLSEIVGRWERQFDCGVIGCYVVDAFLASMTEP